MISVFGPINSGAAVGGDGSATANATSTHPIFGEVMAVYVKYNDSPPAGTTDVTVATAGSTGAPPALTFLTLTNAATDGYHYPRVLLDDTAGAALTAIYDTAVIADRVTVTIAQANAADNVDVWLLMRS